MRDSRNMHISGTGSVAIVDPARIDVNNGEFSTRRTLAALSIHSTVQRVSSSMHIGLGQRGKLQEKPGFFGAVCVCTFIE
jgi:hypothetical protein